MFIEDTISVDGTSDYEMRALLTLSRAWCISRFQVNKWAGNHFLPILERANKRKKLTIFKKNRGFIEERNSNKRKK